MIAISQKLKLDADVLIAGAGPAGATAATYLARAGKKVLLLDFQQFPRDKVCGDFVGPVAIQELNRLGISLFFADAYQSSNLITNAAMFLDGRELANNPLPKAAGLPAFARVIPRLTLDWWILETARKSGAQIVDQCRVTDFDIYKTHVEVVCKDKMGEKRFKVRALIGADGSSSTIARKLNGNKHSSKGRMLAVRAYYDNLEGPAQQADVFYSSDSFPGYYWFFPTGKTTANVGVGMVLETFPENQTHLNELLQNLIIKDPAFRRRIGRGVLQGKIVGWPLSTFEPKMPIVADRILLAGDAAGLINSLNGEGIQTAISSGRWAAETLVDCLQKDALSKSNLDAFRITVEKEVGYDMMLSRVVIEFIRNRTLTPIWLRMMEVISSQARADSSYAAIAGGVLAGTVHGREVLDPIFLTQTFTQMSLFGGMQGIKTMLGGPVSWQKYSETTARLFLNLAEHGYQSPGDYLNWMQGLSFNGLELYKRMWNHAFQKS